VKELANEYKRSADILNKRVIELQKVKDFLTAHTKDPEKDPQIIELKDRIKPLNAMLNDLKEVTKEVIHYYDKGWWRSEKYTLNKRKSRKFIYSEPIYYEACDECEGEREDEEQFEYGYYILDGQAEAGCGDVLHTGEEDAGDSQDAWD